MYRSHFCGELNSQHIGEEVVLSGWVNKYRKLGALVFVDLRDYKGLVQLNFDSEAFPDANDLRNEFVIKVVGKVQARPKDMINKDMKTGEVEIIVQDLEILSAAETPPFEISAKGKGEVDEDLRLKYRYLDLRRDKMQNMLRFRDDMIVYIHNYLKERKYVEVATPLLTASSPEGARDFLVPSRLYPGNFYALPQAPQQFKQLLMVGGLDKYYQIAPCFRDEDPRADRSPGEFYQLDVECSFKTKEEFFQEMEPLFIELTEKLAKKEVWKKPFPRITYEEAMNRWGSDRPDLRYGLELIDLTNWGQSTDFKVFNTAKTIKAIKVEQADVYSRKVIEDELTPIVKKMKAKGLAWLKYIDGEWQGSIAKFFTSEELQVLSEKTEISDNEVVFFVADTWQVATESMGYLRHYLGKKLELADPNLIAWAWIIDFPMYEYDADNDKWDFGHNPFSMPKQDFSELTKDNMANIIGEQYDIIANGLELSSGAVRNHKIEVLYKLFDLVGYDKDFVDNKFSHMVEAFKYGVPPHCGFAPGIERLVMVLNNEDNIREVMAFPKNSKGIEVMTGAPSEVSQEQLDELNIQIKK